MSGFLRTPQIELSRASVKHAESGRSSSLNPPVRSQFHVVQETANEDADTDELLKRIDALAKENKSLKEANRRHMPYNMQLMLLKSEESEAFFRDQMYEKEKELESCKKHIRLLEKRCEEAYEIQHDMENALEEYEVNTKKWEEQLKNSSRRFQELQKVALLL